MTFKKGHKPWNKGKPCSEETKKKISKANKGKLIGDKNPSKRDDVRKKISKKLKGRKTPWLNGKKRPEHSKYMKEHIDYFLNKDNEFGKGNKENLVNPSEQCSGHSKLHDKIKSYIKEMKGYNFISEVKIGKYICDEVDKKRMIIIEINGDRFHANPKLFKENDKPHPYKKELTAKDIWDYDEERKEFLKSLGYKIIYIWERDFKKMNKMELLKWLKKEL